MTELYHDALILCLTYFFCRPRHFLVATQVAKAQLVEEGYFGDTEKSDTEDEDSDLMDINENETGQRSVFIQLDVSFSRVETRHW